MRKCIRCGSYHDNKKICSSCLKKWTSMRSVIWETMTLVHGSFNPHTQEAWIKKTRKLEAIWRKDPEKFNNEIENIKTSKEESNG